MLASELYAAAHSRKCEGPELCHWCGGPCTREIFHDDPPPEPFVRGRNTQLARRWSSPYMCWGCWLWRRTSISVRFLDGELKDRQRPTVHSWWITKDGPVGIQFTFRSLLLPLLLKPPCSFCITLLDSDLVEPSKAVNQIHLAVANDIAVIKAETPLSFTLDNVVYTYTIYELEQATKFPDIVGKQPGVQALVKWMNLPPPKPMETPSGRKFAYKTGNPKQLATDPAIKAIVRLSGVDKS